MKKLPIGVQTFRDFIEQGYLYVDKTKEINDIFVKGGKYCFLSRPRRFGKSVLVSTLAEIFGGNKELFKGLWIYDKIEWTKHPVIYIDFSKITFKSPGILEKALEKKVEKIAQENHIQLDNDSFLKEKFGQLIEELSRSYQQRVVVLIDEYDKPIIEHLEKDKIPTALKIRDVLKNFYSVMKGSDAYIHFVFITGVSKFSKVSIFSDLNNLDDLTLQEPHATLLGYTETELHKYFQGYIEQMAKKRGETQEELLKTIKIWYNGYSWDGENPVYNPFSIVNLFKTGKFNNYWFSTGTPTFLIDLLKERKVDVTEFENLAVHSIVFENYDIENIATSVLLFQTGYLTIKRITVKKEKETFHLTYPNKEVQDSFLTHLFNSFTENRMSRSTRVIETITETVETGDIDGFIKELKTLFASIPNHIIIGEKEAYYHTVIYLVLSLTGATVRCEESTNIGRIDAVLETANKIYIMEFKMGTAAEAIKQIKEKKYYEKYQGMGKEIILLGIGFDANERNISTSLREVL